MEIGNTVQIKDNKSCLDCCAGKRARIAHIGVGGGFLLCTDHFCPIERTEEELELIPIEILAREVLDEKDPCIVAEYMEADFHLLREYAPVDMLAAAVLTLKEKTAA